MATEFWIRNPQRCIKYGIAEGHLKYLFDRALLNAFGRSAHTFMRENFLGTGLDPEFIVIGDQGAQLYNLFTPHEKPLAVWPVWNAETEDMDVLEYNLANPPGEDEALCSDESTTSALRPVYGQRRRVFIMSLAINTKDHVQRKRALDILELCNYYETSVHLHGGQRFSAMFGMPWDSVDWRPDFASRWGLMLPNGVNLQPTEKANWHVFSDWIELVGSSLEEVDNQYERTRYHFRAVKWASENYNSDLPKKRRYSPNQDSVTNTTGRSLLISNAAPRKTLWRSNKNIAIKALRLYEDADGDKMTCNECVLRVACSLARADKVCALEGTEMGELSKHFGTRDADSIIDGLTKLVAMQSDRMEENYLQERIDGEPNPEVRKEMDSVFKNATALARLINPNLNGKGTTVNNQTLNINGAAVPMNDPRQVVAQAVRSLEAAGIPRNEITGEMLKTLLSQGNGQQALEGVVVETNSAQE